MREFNYCPNTADHKHVWNPYTIGAEVYPSGVVYVDIRCEECNASLCLTDSMDSSELS